MERGAAASSAAEATDQTVGSLKGINTVPDLCLFPVHVEAVITTFFPDVAVSRNVLEWKGQVTYCVYGEAVVLMKMEFLQITPR